MPHCAVSLYYAWLRAQVLACLAFTSMCVTALLLGRRPNETQGRILAGVVAAACMVPCRVLLPKLYQSANAPLAAAMIDNAVGRARSGGKAAPSGAARAVSCCFVYRHRPVCITISPSLSQSPQCPF